MRLSRIFQYARQDSNLLPTASHHYGFRRLFSHISMRKMFGSPDYIFAITGATRVVSTEPLENPMQGEYLLSDCSSEHLPAR